MGTRARKRVGGVVGGEESVPWRKYERESKYSQKCEKPESKRERCSS